MRLRRPLAAAAGRRRPRKPPSLSLCSLIFFLALSFSSVFPGASADSRERNRLRSVARVQDAVLHSSASRRVHAMSNFQISLTLVRQPGPSEEENEEPLRQPLRLRLRPHNDILAEDAAIHHVHADGSVTVEPIQRLDHRVFEGDVFVPASSRDDADHWINAGWASIYVHVDGHRPVFEGAFRLHGDNHHLQTSSHFLEQRVAGDPLVPRIQRPEDEYMVVWRDSDIVPDGGGGGGGGDGDEEEPRELRRRQWRRQQRARGEPAQADCLSDDLLFNMDAMHPVYQGINVSGDLGSLGSPGSPETQTARWLFGRQSGDDTGGSGNSAGVNLASTIGDTSGCPTTRKVALVGVAADCTYMQSFADRSNATSNIVQQMSAASRVFEDAFNVSLAIQNLVTQGDQCPTDASTTATPWNADCASGLSISDRLGLFSTWRGDNTALDNSTNSAFWMLLTTCATSTAVGLAWLGQLCVEGASGSGNESRAATNVVVRTSTEWEVMAHETGHIFGAVHDCTSTTCSDGTATRQQCCPLSASTCDARGQYIMNPSTGTGITAFSPCSVGNVCSALGRNSVKSSCLSNNRNVTTFAGGVCGNGIVEAGEECDCGGTEGCARATAATGSSCCDPATCKLAAGALCDPSNDACCTSACQLASAATVCRPSTGSCNPAETCSGTSASCPADVVTPDGTSCGNSGDGLACASGQCTSRDQQCRTIFSATSFFASVGDSGATTTISGDNVTGACAADTGCIVSCSVPSLGSTCLGLSQNFLDGTPCRAGGHCANGQCLGSSALREFGETLRNNLSIVIPVACVVGILLLVAISSCICSVCRRRRYRKQARQRQIQRQMQRQMQQQNMASVPRDGGMMPMTSPDTWGEGGRQTPPKPAPHDWSPPSVWAFWKKRPAGSEKRLSRNMRSGRGDRVDQANRGYYQSPVPATMTGSPTPHGPPAYSPPTWQPSPRYA